MAKVKLSQALALAGCILLFQNCDSVGKSARNTDQNSSGYTTSILNPDGTVTIIDSTPPPASVTIVSALRPSSLQIVAGDNVTLSSELTSTAGTLQYRWFRADVDADAQALRTAIIAKDSAAIAALIAAQKVAEFAETTNQFSLLGTTVTDSGAYHLAALIAGNLASFQSLRINVLERIPLVQTFAAPGPHTWRKPLVGATATVECWGGGGSGGSGGVGSGVFGSPRSSGGGGGGGGGYSRAIFNLAVLNATEPIVVGAGGASGMSGPIPPAGQTIMINNGVLLNSAGLLANGFPGLASSFGNNLVVAGGGAGGTRSQGLALPGAGGAGGTGATANGKPGLNAAIAGGDGGLSGGPGSLFGTAGQNGTGVPQNGIVTVYYYTSGSSGQTGGGGGGGGGNAYGASGGGAGGTGKCLVTVAP